MLTFQSEVIAKKMAEEIQKVHPLLGGYLRMNEPETWQDAEKLVGEIIR